MNLIIRIAPSSKSMTSPIITILLLNSFIEFPISGSEFLSLKLPVYSLRTDFKSFIFLLRTTLQFILSTYGVYTGSWNVVIGTAYSLNSLFHSILFLVE